MPDETVEQHEEPIDPAPLIKRCMLWDFAPHEDVPGMLADFGLVHGSSDVIESEHKAADDRLLLVSPLVELVMGFTSAASEVLTVLGVGVEAAHSDLGRQLMEQQAKFIYPAAVSMLSNLLESGTIEYGEEFLRAAAS